MSTPFLNLHLKFKFTKCEWKFIFQLLQERADKICEMASVMQRSMQIDEENQAREQELMSRLITENKVNILRLKLIDLRKHSGPIL